MPMTARMAFWEGVLVDGGEKGEGWREEKGENVRSGKCSLRRACDNICANSSNTEGKPETLKENPGIQRFIWEHVLS